MSFVPPSSIWNRAFVLVFFASGLQELSFSLLIHLPAYLNVLGGSEGQIGLVFSVAAVIALAVRPAAGRLLDTIGRKRVLAVVAIVDAAAIALYLLVTEFGPPVYVVRMLQGTTEILLFTGYLAYAADALPPAKRTQGMAYFGLSGLVPIAFGPLVGDWLLQVGSYRTILVTSVALGITGWLFVLAMPVLGVERSGTRPRRSFVAAVMEPRVIPVWILTFGFAAAVGVLFTFMATYTADSGAGSVGLFFMVYGLSAAGIRWLAADLPARIGARRVLIPSFVGLGGMFALLALPGSLAAFVVAAGLGGLGHGMLFPILSAGAVDRSRTNERGSTMAFFTALFDVATLAVVPVVGWVIDRSGYPVSFVGVAALLGVALVAYGITERRAPSDPRPGLAESTA